MIEAAQKCPRNILGWWQWYFRTHLRKFCIRMLLEEFQGCSNFTLAKTSSYNMCYLLRVRFQRYKVEKVPFIHHWTLSTIILNWKVSNWNLRISEYERPPGRAKVTLAITKALKVQINFEPQIRRQKFKDHSCFNFTKPWCALEWRINTITSTTADIAFFSYQVYIAASIILFSLFMNLKTIFGHKHYVKVAVFHYICIKEFYIIEWVSLIAFCRAG